MERRMAFVYETLDEKAVAELKAKVSKFQTVLSMTPARVIDRGRDIVFAGLGGRGETPPERGEAPYHYAFLWRGAGVALEGYHRRETIGGVSNIAVTLTRLAIPQQLRNELPEIQQASKEAFALYLSTLNRRPTAVTLHFPAPVYY